MKLSVITINFNNRLGLERTIQSVLSQTFSSFEYIVIDGGSTDDSVSAIEKYSSGITIWKSEPDNGVYHAMNKGILNATGEYLLFMNSGDHFYNEHSLENSLKFLEGKDVVCFDWQIINGFKSSFSNYPAELSFFNFCKSGLPHQSTFIKRILFENYGFYDERLKIVSDWKFFMKAFFLNGATYLKVNQVLSVYYLDGISSTSDQSKERDQVIRELFPYFENDLALFYQNQLSAKKFEKLKGFLLNSRKIKFLKSLKFIDIDKYIN